jgi:segregation and condensation protein B
MDIYLSSTRAGNKRRQEEGSKMEKHIISGELLSSENYKAILECLLFVAPEPLKLEDLMEVAGLNKQDLEIILAELINEYQSPNRGIQLVKIAGGLQLMTKPEFAPYIEKIYKPHFAMLSQAALETLSIIAYRQPVTRAEIEQIRGVKVEGVLTSLLEKKLVKECGRRNSPGRPILYGTTKEFLIYFGLKSLDDLPVIEGLRI